MMYQLHPTFARPWAGHGDPLVIRRAEEAARFSFRIDPRELDAASKAYGLKLPRAIGEMASSDGRTAACLGPDEWYLIAPLSERDGIERAFESIYATAIHSLVDIGHRETGIELSGAAAAFALQAAIAFDIEAMPVGRGCRTLFDRVQIILLREAADRFRIEVWHSFADHVWHLLQTVSREIELGL